MFIGPGRGERHNRFAPHGGALLARPARYIDPGPGRAHARRVNRAGRRIAVERSNQGPPLPAIAFLPLPVGFLGATEAAPLGQRRDFREIGVANVQYSAGFSSTALSVPGHAPRTASSYPALLLGDRASRSMGSDDKCRLQNPSSGSRSSARDEPYQSESAPPARDFI